MYVMHVLPLGLVLRLLFWLGFLTDSISDSSALFWYTSYGSKDYSFSSSSVFTVISTSKSLSSKSSSEKTSFVLSDDPLWSREFSPMDSLLMYTGAAAALRPTPPGRPGRLVIPVVVRWCSLYGDV